jgi:hypothetical protein
MAEWKILKDLDISMEEADVSKEEWINVPEQGHCCDKCPQKVPEKRQGVHSVPGKMHELPKTKETRDPYQQEFNLNRY